MRDLPNWRSLLYVPAKQRRFVEKAHTRGADAIILDLEDAIAPGEKAAARGLLAEAVPMVRQKGQNGRGADVCVRVNRPLRLAVPDIEAAVAAGADVLVLTKLLGPDHVRLLAEHVTEAEALAGRAAGSVRLIGLVETAEAVPQMEAICRASPRLVALGVGGEDLATDLGAEATPDALDLPKRLGVIAARAAGVLPLGFIGTVADITDLESYRKVLRRSKAIGFACASCVHPSQVPILNEEYGERPEVVERARRMVATFEEAIARGVGAVTFEGNMIDEPVAARARAVLARAISR
jgi:citrate lyase subunit beta / citryl-CoA lyase